jgi:DNA-binding transcriptional ArsR family regulator/rhodanese-related sulfurtransferase
MSPSHRPFKDALYEQLARIARATASTKRLELLDLLAQGERSVDDLASETAQSIANASQHLQVLRRAQLVTARREGQNVYYRLAGPEVFSLWRSIRDLGSSRLAEVDRLVRDFLVDRKSLEQLTNQELARRVRSGDVVVIDVRPATEYEQGHIAGALSMPVATIGRRLRELSKKVEIVAYCRGPFCIFADEAVTLLRRRGFAARRLADGFPEWRSEGRPVELGTDSQRKRAR